MRKIIALCLLLASPLFAQNAKVSEQGAASGTFIPPGVILPYAGCKSVGAVSCNTVADASHNPPGWLLSYGQAVSRTTYKNLWAAVGTTYGSGDGSTTFNLPDCRGRSLAGRDNMGGVAAGRITSASPVFVDGTQLAANGGAQAVTPAGTNVASSVPASGLTVSGTVPAHYHTNNGFAYQYLGSTSKGLSSATVDIDHDHGSQAFTSDSSGAHDHAYSTIQTSGGAPNVAGWAYVNSQNYAITSTPSTSWNAGHTHPTTVDISNYDVANRSVVSGTTDISHNHTGSIGACSAGTNGTCSTGTSGDSALTLSGGVAGTATAAAQGFTGTAGTNLPPTLVVNCIIKI